VWLWDQVPDGVRDRGRLWYVGGRKIVDNMASHFQVPDTVGAGVLAAVSPEKDWYQNVSLGYRLLDTVKNHAVFVADKLMDDAFAARARDRTSNMKKYQPIWDTISGKAYNEIDNMPGLTDAQKNFRKALWARMYDEGHRTPWHHVITPEGDVDGLARWETATGGVGAPRQASWRSMADIGRAIKVIESDGSADAISPLMGNKHKMRNFYNNLLNPNSAAGDTTIDTHAVAAGLLRPLSGHDIEVTHNFENSPPSGMPSASGSDIKGIRGTYPLYFEAYKRAADRISAESGEQILPRELQSVTWEAIRSLFNPAFKRTKDKVALIKSDIGATRQATLEAVGAENGIRPPDWFSYAGPTRDIESYAAQEGAVDPAELSRLDLSGGRAGRARPGGRGKPAAAIPAAGPGTERAEVPENIRERTYRQNPSWRITQTRRAFWRRGTGGGTGCCRCWPWRRGASRGPPPVPKRGDQCRPSQTGNSQSRRGRRWHLRWRSNQAEMMPWDFLGRSRWNHFSQSWSPYLQCKLHCTRNFTNALKKFWIS
jgi:hypothetical protein